MGTDLERSRQQHHQQRYTVRLNNRTIGLFHSCIKMMKVAILLAIAFVGLVLCESEKKDYPPVVSQTTYVTHEYYGNGGGAAPVTSGPHCGKWALGDGKGGGGFLRSGDKKIGLQRGQECVKACIAYRKHDHRVSGVTVYSSGKPGCWCEYNMKYRNSNKTYKSCFLKNLPPINKDEQKKQDEKRKKKEDEKKKQDEEEKDEADKNDNEDEDADEDEDDEEEDE